MPHYGYLVVEGPHDAEFVYRLLKPGGFARIRLYKVLDSAWERLVPRTFPHGGDLQKRVPVPLFLANNSHSLAIHSVLGDSRIVDSIRETVAILSPDLLNSIGILLDADDVRRPDARHSELRKGLAVLNLEFPGRPGDVSAGPPATGIFVLPDNVHSGTLESLLLECAAAQYDGLFAHATGFIDGAPHDGLTSDDLKEFRKPAGRSKAVVSAIASILKPGKAIQVSLQDNRWLSDAGLALPRVREVSQFLAKLLGLP